MKNQPNSSRRVLHLMSYVTMIFSFAEKKLCGECNQGINLSIFMRNVMQYQNYFTISLFHLSSTFIENKTALGLLTFPRLNLSASTRPWSLPSWQPFRLFMKMTKLLLLPLAFCYSFLTTGIFGMLLCENGLYCMSDGDCQIGNHCRVFVDGQTNSTRCVPRDDLDDTYYCSLSNKSCECE